MIKQLATLLFLFCLTAGATEIRHLQLNDANLIYTSQSNYALNSPVLLQSNWKSVSVNGNNVILTETSCQQAIKSLDSLSQQEQATILNSKQQLASVEANNPQSNGGQVRRWASISSNGSSITRLADDNLSISSPNLPNNIGRIFINDDVVTYVYFDGQVLMKPIACLTTAEEQLIQQTLAEIQEAEHQYKIRKQQQQLEKDERRQQRQEEKEQRMQQKQRAMEERLQQKQRAMEEKLQQRLRAMEERMQQKQREREERMGLKRKSGQPGQQVTPLDEAGGNFPFGPNNSPFGPGFPFSR